MAEENGHRPVIRLEGISKSFGPVHANRNIHLDIHAGRVHALLGENGAGKSTLMSILAGRLRPDAGRILHHGGPVAFRSAKDALRAGIGMVYQHFMLVPAMTVTENVFLGQEGGFWLNPKRMADAVAGLAAEYRLDIDPRATVAALSMGEKQRVEILKLLLRKSRVLIFDEPTAVLTPRETDHLFAAMRRMTEQGKAIVFISHKLDEVMAISNRISILRAGEIVDGLETRSVESKADLARRMVGRSVLLSVDRPAADRGETVLAVRDLTAPGLHGVSFELRKGEVLAVVGVAGNGQKPLVEAVCGFEAPATGEIEILQRRFRDFFARRRLINTVLGYVPEDRLGRAACPDLDLGENFLLTTRDRFCRAKVWLEKRRSEAEADDLLQRFEVRPRNVRAKARRLSGGNLQKMVLGREFYRGPGLIVAEQPTQGLDIAATEAVWNHLLAARKNAGILLITGDLREALAVADRIAVMFRGRIMDIFPASDSEKVKNIGPLMAGVPQNAPEFAPPVSRADATEV